MLKLVLATHNAHKVDELRKILGDAHLKLMHQRFGHAGLASATMADEK